MSTGPSDSPSATASGSGSLAGASLPLLLAVVTWASAFPAIRRAVEVLSPGQLVVGRLLVASTALAVLLVASPGPVLPRREDLGRLFVVGLLGVSGYQFLLNTGAGSVSVATAAVLVNLAPVVAALGGPRLLGERLTRRQWMGVGLAFAGSVAVSGTDGGGFSISWGAVAVFASAVSAGVFVLLQKPLLVRHDALRVTAWATILSTLPALVFLPSFVAEMGTSEGRSAWGPLLWLGLGSSVVGYVAWAVGLRRTEATRAAVWLYLVPPTAALLGWWWLGERPGLPLVLGGAVSLVGVRLASSRRAVATAVATHPEQA